MTKHLYIWGHKRLIPTRSVPTPEMIKPSLVDKAVLNPFIYFPFCVAISLFGLWAFVSLMEVLR